MIRIEVLAVGREILTGRRLESNSNWIAKRISAFGGRLNKITMVDDDSNAIAGEIRTAKDNGTQFMVIVGGMGPSFDDMTLAGVAKALCVELAINKAAFEFVEDKYHDLFNEGLVPVDGMTPEREKMATLPEGAEWIANPIGTAPGVKISLDDMLILCLPGIPSEMYAMFDLAVVKPLAKLLGKSGFAELTFPTDEQDESLLTRLALELTEKYPGLHVKTNPTYFGDADGVNVTLSAHAENSDAAKALIDKARTVLEKFLAEKAEAQQAD